MNARDLAQRISNGGPVKPSQGGWMVVCPAHDDKTPSLSITDGTTQDVVLYCHAGCTTEQVLAAAGITWQDISVPTSVTDTDERVYPYTDEVGQLLYQVVRRPPKKFLQRRPGHDNEWVWNLRGVRRVLYRFPAVLTAVAQGHEVWLCEGEKDADAVTDHGVCGTTMPGGVGKWTEEFSAVLEGADVTIWADRDEPGWRHAHAVRDSLIEHGVAQVRIVESKKGKDASDHLGAGFGLDDVLVTVPYEEHDAPALFMRIDEFLGQPRNVRPWAIPGLMRRGGERLVLTGFEGNGKSAMLKQIAFCTALGVNPFTLMPNEQPKRVVFIDCENPVEDVMEDFDRLQRAAIRDGRWFDTPDLFVECHPPINLSDLPDAAWLAERARAHEPDLLVIGPLYNMMSGDSAKEVEVNRMLRVLGKVQVEVDCALVLEHHTPHANGAENRPIRPIGSTVLMRWASFGFGLLPTDTEDRYAPFLWQGWRGSRRRGREWPSAVRPIIPVNASQEGEGWYWQECEPPE